MDFSDNLINMDPWILRPTFADSWLSEAFTTDNEALTKALQKSLSGNHFGDGLDPLYQPDPTPTPVQTPETKTVVSKGRSSAAVGVNGGKITKRKQSKSKRSTTTFIKADPANFRQMVQQVTGVRADGNLQLPVLPVFIPDPGRRQDSNRMQQCGCLPTLDTSAHLLEATKQQQQQQHVGPASGLVGQTPVGVSVPPLQPEVVEDGGVDGGFDFGPFCNFPTLQSWNIM